MEIYHFKSIKSLSSKWCRERTYNPLLSWKYYTDGKSPRYDVYFGTEYDPPLIESNYASTTYDPGELEPGTTYYWKIVAKEAGGITLESPIWQFTTNRLKWKFKFDEAGTWTSPVTGNDGTIYIRGSKHIGAIYTHFLYAINPDGTLKWKFNICDTESRCDSCNPIIGNDGTIYISVDALYAVNPDGTLKWKFEENGFPIIGADGTIYLGSDALYAINPDGSLKWKIGIATDRIPEVGNDGTIYIGGSKDNYLYAINPDATLKWKYKLGDKPWDSAESIKESDNTIYVTTSQHLYAIDLYGELKWKYKIEGEYCGLFGAKPITGSNSTIYIGTTNFWSNKNYLYAINPDGTLKWKFKTNRAIFSSPAIGSDGTIYIGSFDSYLYAINPDGTLKWEFESNDAIASTPVTGHDKTIYIASLDGYLYAVSSYSPSTSSHGLPYKVIFREFEEIPGMIDGYFVKFIDLAVGKDQTIYTMVDIYHEFWTDFYDGVWDYRYVCAINPDGTIKWKFKIEDCLSPGSKTKSDTDSVMSILYAINPDCTLKWELKMKNHVTSPGLLMGNDGTIYIGTGTLLYNDTYSIGPREYFKNNFFNFRLGNDQTIYVETMNLTNKSNYLHAINPDGTVKWRFCFGSKYFPLQFTVGNDGTAYIFAYIHSIFRDVIDLYVVNPDGTLKWKFKTNDCDFSSNFAIGSDGTVYIHADDLYAIKPNGKLKWKFEFDDNQSSSDLTIGSDGTIYIRLDDLYAINPDGTLKWKFKNANEFIPPLVSSNNTIYMLKKNNKNESSYSVPFPPQTITYHLYAIKASNGTVKWEFKTNNHDYNDINIIHSNIVVGSEGTVYAQIVDAIYAINPDGTQKFEYWIADYSKLFVIGNDGTVYVGSDALYAINPDGTLKWSIQKFE